MTDDLTSGYEFKTAGTYYLVFSLVNADPANPTNVWADGTTEDITFTLVIGGNVKRITSTDVINESSMTADTDDDLYITGSVAESATIKAIATSGYYTVTLYGEDGDEVANSTTLESGYAFQTAGGTSACSPTRSSASYAETPITPYLL